MTIRNSITADLVLVNKSDVRRSRVLDKHIDRTKEDINDRVNYVTKE